MKEVYLALGANVGDAAGNIAKAISLLAACLQEVKQAPLYRSKPAGYAGQPDFVNSVIRGQTGLSPEELFSFVKQVEQQVGRVERFRWGPREIDIDIIFYGDQIIKSSKLTIPHPRFAERDFVLKPLADLDPNLKDPLSGKTIGQLLAAVGNLTDLQPLGPLN